MSVALTVDRHNPRRSGDLKILVKHSSRENRNMQGLDQVPGVSWLLCAIVSKGLEALGGCAHCGKRTRSTDFSNIKMDTQLLVTDLEKKNR